MTEKEAININIYSNKSSSSNLLQNNNKIEKSLLEEQLKCSICNNLYDTEIHYPYIIKCGHTFCKQCIFNNNIHNNICPIDNTPNSFELYIKNIQLEIILNKFIYNNNAKTMPIQKQLVYIKPDIKRNKNSNYEKDEEINNINNEIPNRIRGKSNNQRFRNSDYKIYDNNFQNSPVYKKNSKKNSKNNIIPKNINNENNMIYTKKDNIINLPQFINKNIVDEIINDNDIDIIDNGIVKEKNEFVKENKEENFRFEDEKIGDMLINESIETIPINEEKSFTNLSIREEFNDLLTKNEIYKKRIVINNNNNNNNNLNKNEENKNNNNININYRSPCKKIIVKDTSNINNHNENYFYESNKKILLDEMAFTIPKQFMKSSNFNINLNSDKEICTNENRQLTESNNNTEKKLKENKTFQNFFNSTNSNKNNSMANTNSNTNNGTNNKNVKTVFDYIQSISNKPSIANNNINIIEKKNEDSSNKHKLIPNSQKVSDINNDLTNKILKNNGSLGEMKTCKKYIKVRASSKISKKKSNIIHNSTHSDCEEENNNSKKNISKNTKLNQIKVVPKRDSNENTINKNNDSNKCINLSTLYNKKKIKSPQNNSESINNSQLSLEKYINGVYNLNKQKPIEINRKEINCHSSQKNNMFNNNINNINIMISPDKNNIFLNKNGTKTNFINNEIISKTINLSPINPNKDMKNNLKQTNKNTNNEKITNNINSIINLNFITSEEKNKNNILEQNPNNLNNNINKKDFIKTRSQSINKNKIISVNSKISSSQLTLKNNNFLSKQDINNLSPSKPFIPSKNEIINKLKKEYELLPFKDKLIDNKKKYDDFFNKALDNPLFLEIISNINKNYDLISIKFIKNDDLFIGEFEQDLITPKKGILLTINGEYYEGEFMNGKKDGRGKLIYKNGTEYIGDFKNNRHNGYGQLTQMDGEIFQGEWKEGKINGNGTRFHSNGDKYIGNYINNIRNGHGYYIFANGDSYEGNWKNGKANGIGVFKYNNGNVYEGEFKDNLISGKGKFVLKNGDIYSGVFSNGLINGKGTMVNNKGEKYVGYFLNGTKNGIGKLMNKNGKVIQQGYWKKDKFLGNKDYL